jgi:hypothetical protein
MDWVGGGEESNTAQTNASEERGSAFSIASLLRGILPLRLPLLLEMIASATVALGEAKMDLPPRMAQLLDSVLDGVYIARDILFVTST